MFVWSCTILRTAKNHGLSRIGLDQPRRKGKGREVKDYRGAGFLGTAIWKTSNLISYNVFIPTKRRQLFASVLHRRSPSGHPRVRLTRMGYLTVAKRVQRTETVKGSRFIALVVALESLAQVERVLDDVRTTYSDASHHCFAYIFEEHVRFNDDGEPGGTAGRPMLEVLSKRGLGRTLAVVTRYFGGAKLGAGGLVRAYGGSVAKALDEAGIVEVKDKTVRRFEIPFATVDSVHRLLDDWNALSKDALTYSALGAELRVTLLAEDLASFEVHLSDLTNGQVKWLEAD